MPKPLEYRNSLLSEPGSPPLSDGRWRWNCGGVLLLLIVLLPALASLAYVRAAWAMVFYRLIIDGSLACLWVVAAAGMGTSVMRWAGLWDDDNRTEYDALPPDNRGDGERQTTRRLDDNSATLRIATSAALGLGIMSLVTLGLGLIGILGSVSAWTILASGWTLAAWNIWILQRNSDPHSLQTWLKAPAGSGRLWLLAIPFLMLALVGAMVPPGMLWTPQEPHGYDVVEYHLQIPREWYEAHRILPLHHNVFSYFPFNVEMHYLLAMHLMGGPWAGMYLAQLMHLGFMILTVLAVYGLARRTVGQVPATLAGLSLLTVPWLTQLACVAYDEGGFLLFGTLAVGGAVGATFDPRHRYRRFALAGAFAGFAAGSKLTAVPEVCLAMPIVCGIVAVGVKLSKTAAGALRETFIGITLFCVVCLITFSPWLARNVAWAHNPVFPELMPILGSDHFSAAQVQRWESAHKPPPAQQSITARVGAWWREVACGWQFGYALFPLAAIAFAFSLRRPEAWCLGLLLLILTLFWLAFTHLQPRFFILAVPICALLLAHVDWGRATKGGLAIIVIFAAMAWIGINRRLAPVIYGNPAIHLEGLIQPSNSFQPLGNEDLSWMNPEAIEGDKLPSNATLMLAGDARAFHYQLPMSRLKYRTVFDVNSSNAPGMIDAWTEGGETTTPAWILVDPDELRRFSKTYKNLGPLPPEINEAHAPFVIKR